ncbi:MAG: response regulator [Ktedonobacteraceae bacterium]|nr:response regulator [Ktedonobacteraceae bacterium]
MPLPKKPSLTRDPSEKTILVVEDEPITRHLLGSIIEDETPYHAALASSGRQALEVVQTIQPHLFSLDYFLPDMNGVELYERLRQIEHLSTIPTIFLTTQEMSSVCHAPGILSIRKPFD